MEQVYYRATTIFEAINDPQDRLFFVVQHTRPSQTVTSLEGLRRYLNDKALMTSFCCTRGHGEVLNDPEFEDWEIDVYYYVLECKVSDIRYTKLLKAISNKDMGIKPKFHYECFFINTSKGVIFHQYDDRGLDVVSNSVSAFKRAIRDLLHMDIRLRYTTNRCDFQGTESTWDSGIIYYLNF